MKPQKKSTNIKKNAEELDKDGVDYFGPIEEIINSTTDIFADIVYSSENHEDIYQITLFNVKKFRHAVLDKRTYNNLIDRGVFKENSVMSLIIQHNYYS